MKSATKAGMEFWTPERNSELTKLWADGLSANEVATVMDCGLTRSAVIGKVHRLKLPGRTKPQSAPREPRPRRTRAKPRPDGVQRHAASEPGLESEPFTAVADIDIPGAQRCGLLDLTSGKCHWPVGDPTSADFYFCGGSSVTGRPYCWAHTRIAYQPAQPRRRGPEWRPYQ